MFFTLKELRLEPVEEEVLESSTKSVSHLRSLCLSLCSLRIIHTKTRGACCLGNSEDRKTCSRLFIFYHLTIHLSFDPAIVCKVLLEHVSLSLYRLLTDFKYEVCVFVIQCLLKSNQNSIKSPVEPKAVNSYLRLHIETQ